MQTKLQQLKQKREKCKAQIKEKQNELRSLTSAITLIEWRKKKKENEI